MRIRAKTFNNKTFPIGSNKLFEIILKLEEPLSGQSVKISSPFSDDNTPSFLIFYSDKGLDDYYRFKCFSSGKSGDAIDLFMEFYGKKYQLEDRQDAYYKILEIVNNNAKLEKYVNDKSSKPIEKETKEIKEYQIRKVWTKRQADFWREHGCQKEFIKEYNIKPLNYYEIVIKKGKFQKVLSFAHDLCFGYFTKANELYKIYNPGNKKGKFIKVKDYLQGSEQMKPNKKYCLIMASIKDVGAFKEMGFNQFNCIIPDSENVDLPKDVIEKLKEDHDYVFTMFDNDVAGMKRMNHYWKEYQIPYIHFNIEKDFAQCRFDHGKENTKLFFTKIFKEQLPLCKKRLSELSN